MRTLGTTAAKKLLASSDYPLDPVRVRALASAAAEYDARLVAAKRARDAATAAMKDKDAAGEALVRALSVIAWDLVHNDSITDAQILGIGFAPRPPRNPRPKEARTVTGLRATPAVDGSVRLAWGRNGNSHTTTFVAEASADGERWRMVGTTVRKSLKLEGFTPGRTAWFRVVASNSQGVSIPSVAVPIYPGVAAEAARRAA